MTKRVHAPCSGDCVQCRRRSGLNALARAELELLHQREKNAAWGAAVSKSEQIALIDTSAPR